MLQKSPMNLFVRGLDQSACPRFVTPLLTMRVQRALCCFVFLFFLAKPAFSQDAVPDRTDAQNQQVRSLLQNAATQKWKDNMYDAGIQLPSGGTVGAVYNAACLGNVDAIKQIKKKGFAGVEPCASAAGDLVKSGYIVLAAEWDDKGCRGGSLFVCNQLGKVLEQIGNIAWAKNNKQAAVKIWHTACDDYENEHACIDLKYQAEENIDLDATEQASKEATQAARDQYDAAEDADASRKSTFLSVLEAINQGLTAAAATTTANAPQGADPIQQSLNQSLANLNVTAQNAQRQQQASNAQPSRPGAAPTMAYGLNNNSTAPANPNPYPAGGPNTIAGSGLPPTNPPAPSSNSGSNSGTSSNGSSPTGSAQQTMPGGQFNNCITSFYDPAEYNWLAYKNNCTQALSVTFIARTETGVGSTGDPGPGASFSTGYSASEVNAKNGFELYICLEGYLPVDANGNGITGGTPAKPFACKPK